MTLQQILDETDSTTPEVFAEKPAGSKPVSTFSDYFDDKNYTPEYLAWREEKFGEVTIRPKIEHPDISDTTKLRRFIDLPKFLDLLTRQRLLLPQLSHLMRMDPFECNVPFHDPSLKSQEQIKQRVLKLEPFAPAPERAYPPLDLFASFSRRKPFERPYLASVSAMDLDELKKAAWFLEHARLKRQLMCNCWYGSTGESDAMWRIYCDKIGVSITTSVAKLKSAVKVTIPRVFVDHFKLTLARVKYPARLPANSETPWLIKRRAFRHEHEVRLFVDYPNAFHPGLALDVNPLQFIEEITISPFAEKWQVETIRGVWDALTAGKGNRLRPAGKIKISQSMHLKAAEPGWPESSNYFAPFEEE